MGDFKPFWEEKNWGRVLHIFANPSAAVSCLELVAGQCCSRHLHNDRANLFAVLEGQLVIEEWPGGLQKPSVLRCLSPGDVHAVSSCTWHRFRVLKHGRAVEVYWADKSGAVSIYDIHRMSPGRADPVEDIERDLLECGAPGIPAAQGIMGRKGSRSYGVDT